MAHNNTCQLQYSMFVANKKKRLKIEKLIVVVLLSLFRIIKNSEANIRILFRIIQNNKKNI
tara:strand:- start:4646 stop:4828 length:183 start_codon:yes stop_codon:yes gene_type:complete